jgi:hypothetical protein
MALGFIPAAGKGAIERSVPTNTLADPAHGFALNPRSKLGASQTGKLRIQCRYQRFRQHCHVGRRRVHQAKIVGAGNVEALGDHV